MLNTFYKDGSVKLHVKAYHNSYCEFIIYQTHFGNEKFEDVYAGKIAIVSIPPGYTADGAFNWLSDFVNKHYPDCILAGLIT
jgi:hypothetical protein